MPRRLLITSGPTRQYLDPVRYLTNASSGRMGAALAAAALQIGYEVVVVSGPVEIEYPTPAEIIHVLSTEEMLSASREAFANCDGLIGAAAPCDYRTRKVEEEKISKTGKPILLELIETPDIVATLAAEKRPDQWIVGFALETQDARFRAITKLERKSCDLIVLNGPEAMNAADNSVEIIDPTGNVIASFVDSKEEVARQILAVIEKNLAVERKTT